MSEFIAGDQRHGNECGRNSPRPRPPDGRSAIETSSAAPPKEQDDRCDDHDRDDRSPDPHRKEASAPGAGRLREGAWSHASHGARPVAGRAPGGRFSSARYPGGAGARVSSLKHHPGRASCIAGRGPVCRWRACSTGRHQHPTAYAVGYPAVTDHTDGRSSDAVKKSR